MTRDSATSIQPAHVLIVGGGIAGVEALLALADLGEGELHIELLAAHPSFTLRPQILGIPWGGAPVQVDLAELCAGLGARFIHGTVTGVDAALARVLTSAGTTHSYERLLLAPGGRTALPYALTRTLGFGELPRTLASAVTGSVAIVVPPGTSWTLPAYELALLTAAEHPDRDVRVLTFEGSPLEAFGPGVEDDVRGVLERIGVTVETGRLVPTGADVSDLADTVIALPLVGGPGIPGVPTTAGGFIRVDDWASVLGLEHVYAAGDATDRPIKQGGLAGQQADHAAAGIVRSCGSSLAQPPAMSVLRGKLSVRPGEELFLRRVLNSADQGEASARPLWMPPSVVCAWRLARWLTMREPDPSRRALGHVAPGGVAG